MTSAIVVNLSLSKSFGYDTSATSPSKSDVGTYVYQTSGAPRPHAVSSISGHSTPTYDNNGNQTTGAGLTYVYSSYNKPHRQPGSRSTEESIAL